MNPSVLVAIILLITYSASFIEKLKNWNGTLTYYHKHFEKTIIQKFLRSGIILVILLELFCVLTITSGIYLNQYSGDTSFLEIGFYSSFILLSILLIGQRIAQDYQGSTSLIVYILLNIFGIYVL